MKSKPVIDRRLETLKEITKQGYLVVADTSGFSFTHGRDSNYSNFSNFPKVSK
jgi:hypothetical protein